MIMQVKTMHPLFQHQNIDIALFVNEKILFISLSILHIKQGGKSIQHRKC